MSNFKRLMKGHDEEKTTRFDVLVGIRNVDILSDEEKVKEVLSDSLKGSVYVNKKVAQAKPENIYCIGPWVRVFALTNEDDFPVFKERVLTIDGVLDVERFGDLWRDAAAKRTFLERGKRFKEYCKKSLKQNMQDFSKHGVAKYVGSYDKQSVQDFLKSVNECEAEINIVFGNENGFENYVIKTKTFSWYRDA